MRVNGNTARLGEQADGEEDVIELDGVRVRTRQEPEKIYRMLCKPRGFVTTMHDEKGRRSVAELVADLPERVYPVGRLDCNSEGLLLLTNDGELANKLTHPSHEVSKRYYVVVDSYVSPEEIKQLERGVVIEGGKTAPARIKVMNAAEGRTELTIIIHEGRNRQVRRMFETIDKHVVFLKRISEGDINLGPLKRGEYRMLTKEEVAYLKSIK